MFGKRSSALTKMELFIFGQMHYIRQKPHTAHHPENTFLAVKHGDGSIILRVTLGHLVATLTNAFLTTNFCWTSQTCGCVTSFLLFFFSNGINSCIIMDWMYSIQIIVWLLMETGCTRTNLLGVSQKWWQRQHLQFYFVNNFAKMLVFPPTSILWDIFLQIHDT